MRSHVKAAPAGSTPGQGKSRGPFAFALSLAAICLFVLGLIPSAALASKTHLFDAATSTAFGSNPGANGVAIDQSSGDVYVAQGQGNAVAKYSASGQAVTAFGENGLLSGPNPPSEAFSGPYGLAVDQSSHDLYVADLGHGFLDKFDSAGKLVEAFATKGQLGSGNSENFLPAGIAVDPTNGDLYITDLVTGTVQKYDSAGKAISAFGEGSGSISVPGANGVAVDSSGRLYVSTQSQALSFSSEGQPLATVDDGSNGPVQGLGVDPSNDNLYATEQGQVAQFDSSGNLVSRFGAGHLGNGFGVAVNEATGETYIGDNANGVVAAFGPLVTVPDAITREATSITPFSATLNGTADADGAAGAACHFEYVSDTAFQSEGGYNAPSTATAPCSTSPVTGTGPVSVHADISALALNTAYHFRIAANNGTGGDQQGADQTFATPTAVPSLSTDPAANVTGESAELNGSYTGLGPSTDVHYFFEYGTDLTYGHKAPVSPADAGSLSGPQQVAPVLIKGLEQGTVYHYRIVASDSFGTTTGPDRTLTTLQQPSIVGFSSSNVAAESADLDAQIDPNGQDTSYHFEYGTTASYGQSAPVPDEDIGAAEAPQSVSVHIGGLQSGVTYHFRLVAHSAVGTTTSGDQTFEFTPAACPNAHQRQETGASSLPDCRAYELVSPTNSNGAFILAGGPLVQGEYLPAYVPNGWSGAANTATATAPSHLAYTGALGALSGAGDVPNAGLANGDQYVATRTTDGWVSRYVGLPGDQVQSDGGQWADLGMSKYISYEISDGREGSDNVHGFGKPPLTNAPNLWDASGNHLGRWPTNLNSVPGLEEGISASEPSPDFSHFFFISSLQAATKGPPATGPGPWVFDNNTTTGTVQIASKLPNGEDIPGAVGFPGYAGITKTISTDGSHLLMTTATGLYMRVNDAVTYEVSRGQSVNYLGMTEDGSRVFFTTAATLTADDTDTSVDLYMWSEAGDRLTLLSAGNNGTGDTNSCSASWVPLCGVATISPIEGEIFSGASDNSLASHTAAVLFYSPEQLDGNRGIAGQRNLYEYLEGDVHFIASLEPQGPATRMQVSPNGAHVAFLTASRITSYDNAGDNEMYLYDALSGQLRCASCNPSGQPPASSVKASQNGLFMTDDGRAFFSTDDSLVPRDTDQIGDVYEFVDGRPRLITPGTGALNVSPNRGGIGAGGLDGVSADGTDVYFITLYSIVAEDENGTYTRIYDARSGGGFDFSPPPSPCAAADECHGAGNSAPEAPQLATSASLGADGNIASTKAHKKRSHKKHPRHSHKRTAGHKGGGPK